VNEAHAVTVPAAGGVRIRVLVVDDSLDRRAELTAALQTDPEIEVVGWAVDGAGAVRTAAWSHPDVITLDLRMAAMDGVAIKQQIMREVLTPIVVVGASGEEATVGLSADAGGAGVVAIRSESSTLADGLARARELCRTVKRTAGARPPCRQAAAAPGTAARLPRATRRAPGSGVPIVAIGASTGGPQALGVVLAGLPATLAVPVLVVQHIASGFLPNLVEWLRSTCALPLAVAEDGQPLTVPGIYLAPTGRHMVVQARRLTLTDEPPVSSHRPSVTVLFQSVAREHGSAAVGVQLTGMGDDGAAGLLAMRQAGATTIAQDEATSVVFGMPEVAIALGSVELVLPIQDIAPCVVRHINHLIARHNP